VNAMSPSFRRILWERQEHKCIACGTEIASHKDAGRGKIGREQFVACAPCVSTCGEYESLADFIHDHSTGHRIVRLEQRRLEKEAKRVENPEGYQAVQDAVRALGSDMVVPDHYRYLPTDAKFENIAHLLVNGSLSIEERIARAKAKAWRRRNRRGRVRTGANRIAFKLALGEAQNHRCAYCQCEMHYEKLNTYSGLELRHFRACSHPQGS
jgi:ribosomal protein L34E